MPYFAEVNISLFSLNIVCKVFIVTEKHHDSPLCCDDTTLPFNIFSFIFRRKTETDIYPNRSNPWMSTTASPFPVQGPYAFSDITKLPHTALDSNMSADIMAKYSCPPSQNSQCDDYENVSCTDRESGFVTNDIYETCRPQSRRYHSQTGWVENEIYG